MESYGSDPVNGRAISSSSQVRANNAPSMTPPRASKTSLRGRRGCRGVEIAAGYDVWTEVLAGRLDPVIGMMLGKLKLSGNMGQIASHAKAAKALVACAASVEATPPAG